MKEIVKNFPENCIYRWQFWYSSHITVFRNFRFLNLLPKNFHNIWQICLLYTSDLDLYIGL